MDSESNKIFGEHKGEVRNRVVIALLQAYLDILDYDGLKSILREAEMLHIKDLKNIDPEGTLDFFSFKKIIFAQNLLLYGCSRLCYKLGEKFAFYLFPYGLSFENIIREINELIETDWKVEIIEKTENFITVQITNCFFCSENEKNCNLIDGFMVYSLKNSLPDDMRVIYSLQEKNIIDNQQCIYVLKLRWKKK